MYRASYAAADAPRAYDDPAWQAGGARARAPGEAAEAAAAAEWPAPLYGYAAAGTAHDVAGAAAAADPATGEPADALEPAAGSAAAADGPRLEVPGGSWAAVRLPETGPGGRYVTAGPDAGDGPPPPGGPAAGVHCPDGEACVFR